MARKEIVRREDTGMMPRAEWDPFRLMQERMRELLSWDPFQEMARMLPAGMERGFVPPFEIRETDNSYVFRADVPGVKEEDLEVTLTGNRLTVSGKREMEERKEGERYFSYECSYGAFTRSFTLPEGVDANNIRSELKDGVLTLMLPKRPEVQPKHIPVKGAGKAAKA